MNQKLRKYTFLLLAMLFSTFLKAQTVMVKGIVKDTLTQKNVQGASVIFYDKNRSILKSIITADDGSFLASLDSSKAVSFKVSFTGFVAKELTLFYNKKEKDYNLGSIFLFPKSSSLIEVVVEGKKPPINFKVDRQVYKSAQFSNASGGSAVDIIRNLPSIAVNGQGEISFRGSTSFLVLINGKPTQGEPAFVLSQLSASSIENIEVITSPSAVFDADGKSGIINIVTKNGIDNGFMIQVNTMGGLPPLKNYDNNRNNNPQRYSFDVSTAYRKNKIDISAGINYVRNDIAGNREGNVFTIINTIKTSFPSYGERSFKRYNYGTRLAAAYQINKHNSISTGLYVGKKFQSRIADLLYTNKRENLLTGATQNFNYFNANDQEKEGVFTLANIDFTHEFLNKSKLIFSALFESANLFGTTYNNNLAYPFVKDTLQYTVNPYTNPLNAFRLKADYTKKVGIGLLQVGYQYRNDTQKGDFLYLTKIIGTNNFVTDPLFTSNVQVANYIHAAYFQYAATLKKLSYSTGLRVEQSKRNLNFSKNNEKKTLDLTNLFPSVQIRYKIGEKATAKAGYSRRVKRTNNFELNPFPEREHSETLEQGDPELLPELIGTYEIGIEQTFKNGSFFGNIYYQNARNPIQRVNKVFNDTILNRVFTNASKATQIGFETNFTMQINKAWQTTIGGNIYKYKILGNIFNGSTAVDNSSWVYSINSTQSFSLPKNWLLQLSVNYLSLRATAQGEDGRFFTPHFTVKKTSNNKKWNVQFQWLNIDAGLHESNRQRITTSGSNFFTTTNYIYETDQLQLSVAFNLLKKNRKITLPQSEIGEKEF